MRSESLWGASPVRTRRGEEAESISNLTERTLHDSMPPGGDAVALAEDWEEVATENAAVEDATGALSKPMLKMNVGRLR